MSNKGQLLQDPFLNLLRKEHVPVSIYLVNGIKLQGQIESFDQYVVLLRNTVTQMVYKHAISTVVPGRAVNFHADESRANPRPDAPRVRPAPRPGLQLAPTCRAAAGDAPTRAILVGVDLGAGSRFDADPRRTGLLAESAGDARRSNASSRGARRPMPALFVG